VKEVDMSNAMKKTSHLALAAILQELAREPAGRLTFEAIENAIRACGQDPYEEDLYGAVLEALEARGLGVAHQVVSLERYVLLERVIAHEQQELAASLRQAHREKRRLLTPSEERQLLEMHHRAAVAAPDDSRAEQLQQWALDTLVIFNVRLVHKYALQNLYRCQCLTLEDLVQEGVTGLIKAIRDFDLARGERLSTYAVWWIRQAIGRAIVNHDPLIRVPVHAVEFQAACRKARRTLWAQWGRMPTAQEVAVYLQARPEQVERADQLPDTKTASLDAPAGDGDVTLLHTLTRAHTVDRATEVAVDTRRAELHALIRQVLTPREAHVILMRTGLAPGSLGQTHTLEALGERLGLTRERIRQIQVKALNKLRKSMERAGFQYEDFQV
jgi:RNA polymerase primary sigma factor